MVPSAHDLRRHVAWSSAGVLMVVLPQLPTHPKICNAQVALRVQD